MNEGIVFNLQRWSIHDGPGIRTTVFVKGCPLRCKWCSNPESMKLYPEIMVRDLKCIGCGKCVAVCPQQAISLADNKRMIDWARCDHCLKCVDVCPPRSIVTSGEKKTVEEVISVVMKDLNFYRRSKGGMTVSGGEALFQWRFVLNLLKAARKKGIHTALDTTGYGEWEILEQLLEYTSLLLYDVKHLDSEKHKEGTGVPNELILENLGKAVKKSTVWIRRLIIPDYNDSDEDIIKLAKFVSTLNPQPVKISLLPFHKFAGSKYISMGKSYAYSDVAPIPEQRVVELKQLIESFGVKVDIGK